MDWETLSCPNPFCRSYGCPFPHGLLVKNGATRGQNQALCRACGRSVALQYGTASFDLDADPAIFETAIRAVAEGNSLRATGRIVQIAKDTACAWLHRAAVHCRLVMLSLWRNLTVTDCQLDELGRFVPTTEQPLQTAKLVCATYGEGWIWIAFAPVWRLVLAFVAGKRTQASAKLLLERVAYATAATIPFCTSDQLPEYRSALRPVYGQWYQPAPTGDRGRFPDPRRGALPDLRSAQVVQQRERGAVLAVSPKVGFGTAAAIPARLATLATRTTINPSVGERENLTLRQHNRRLTRKTNGFSQELMGLEKQRWLSLAYYHVVVPHESLRQPVAQPTPTRGAGSAQCWLPVTPAMAAGLTDHVWTTAELVSSWVPVTFLAQLPEVEHLGPPFSAVHQGN